MPSLGADMESGTILSWYVKPGDEVARGQIVGLVDTDKAEIEIEIWTPGRVERILVEPGREVAVGVPLLALSEPSAGSADAAPRTSAAASPPAAPPAAPPTAIPPSAPRPSAMPLGAPPSTTAPSMAEPPRAPHAPREPSESVVGLPIRAVASATGERIRATPLARRLAQARRIDLDTLHGTGPEGRIRAEDVERAAAPRVAPPGPAPSARPVAATPLAPERLAAIARGMAAAMTRSKREIPHYYLALDVDMQRALAWLERANRERPITERLLLQVLLLKATARALVEVPELNGHWLEDRFVPAQAVHLGVAITVRGGGLLAPALHDVDRRDLDDLMRGLSDLVARTRRAQLRAAEVRDATATVSSLTDRGPDRLYGVIYPPQVALVGFGGVRERPWAENGLLGVRPVLTVTLAADHRASDGLRGTRLLRRIARALEAPETLA